MYANLVSVLGIQGATGNRKTSLCSQLVNYSLPGRLNKAMPFSDNKQKN